MNSLLILFAVVTTAQTPADLVAGGHFKRARPLLEQQVKTNPNDAQAWYLLSKVKTSFDDIAGALAPTS